MTTYNTYIDKEEINQLPPAFFPGSIVTVDTQDALDKALAYLNQQTIVGFDTETKPVFTRGKRNKVALLQLSTMDVCFLIRMNLLGFPKELNDFFRNSNVKKIGLSIKDDYLMLRGRNAEFKAVRFVELKDYCKNLGIEVSSLQKIYALLFAQRISKSQRLSNWEAEKLTPAQQNYAALDAYACLKIYNELERGEAVFVVNSSDDKATQE